MSPGKRGKSAVFLDECACKKFKDINGSMVPSPVPSPVARTSSCLGKVCFKLVLLRRTMLYFSSK